MQLISIITFQVISNMVMTWSDCCSLVVRAQLKPIVPLTFSQTKVMQASKNAQPEQKYLFCDISSFHRTRLLCISINRKLRFLFIRRFYKGYFTLIKPVPLVFFGTRNVYRGQNWHFFRSIGSSKTAAYVNTRVWIMKIIRAYLMGGENA